MRKTLQQIKDEYAKEHGYKNYDVLLDKWQPYYAGKSVNEIAIRYAQEVNKELVEMLELLDRAGGLGHDRHERIRNLIEKYKGD